jgi:hypothetical protein
MADRGAASRYKSNMLGDLQELGAAKGLSLNMFQREIIESHRLSQEKADRAFGFQIATSLKWYRLSDLYGIANFAHVGKGYGNDSRQNGPSLGRVRRA